MEYRKEKYSAGIMAECPWFVEFKKYIHLKLNSVSDEEIRRRCLEENLFGLASENRKKRTYQYISKRVALMDERLMDIFCNSDLGTQKIINLITILRFDRLFFEFVNEVYREKAIIGIEYIDASDYNTFFRTKSVEAEELTKWSDSAFSHVRSSYFSFLTDANLIKKDGSKFMITVPILDDSLSLYLRENSEESLLKAITGVK